MLRSFISWYRRHSDRRNRRIGIKQASVENWLRSSSALFREKPVENYQFFLGKHGLSVVVHQIDCKLPPAMIITPCLHHSIKEQFLDHRRHVVGSLPDYSAERWAHNYVSFSPLSPLRQEREPIAGLSLLTNLSRLPS